MTLEANLCISKLFSYNKWLALVIGSTFWTLLCKSQDSKPGFYKSFAV